MQIYRELRSRIISGAFVYGAKLPSKRVLAKECLVSIITVEHAYQLLCDEGYCEMKPRSGCYVKYCADSFFPVSDGQNDSVSPVVSAVLHTVVRTIRCFNVKYYVNSHILILYQYSSNLQSSCVIMVSDIIYDS